MYFLRNFCLGFTLSINEFHSLRRVIPFQTTIDKISAQMYVILVEGNRGGLIRIEQFRHTFVLRSEFPVNFTFTFIAPSRIYINFHWGLIRQRCVSHGLKGYDCFLCPTVAFGQFFKVASGVISSIDLAGPKYYGLPPPGFL